jgi:hypothetical protein
LEIDQKDLVIAKMVELFGDKIADPEIFPKIFDHQVKMAKYQIFLEKPIPPVVIEGEPEDLPIPVEPELPPVDITPESD